MKTIRLKAGKERSLLRRHPWVFDSAIAKGGGDAGETVRVDSSEGGVQASGPPALRSSFVAERAAKKPARISATGRVTAGGIGPRGARPSGRKLRRSPESQAKPSASDNGPRTRDIRWKKLESGVFASVETGLIAAVGCTFAVSSGRTKVTTSQTTVAAIRPLAVATNDY